MSLQLTSTLTEGPNLNTIHTLFRTKPTLAPGLLVCSMMRYLRRRILNFGHSRIFRSGRRRGCVTTCWRAFRFSRIDHLKCPKQTAQIDHMVWPDGVGYNADGYMLQHCTFLINSACHTLGRQPYSTRCSARDSLVMALFTFGEGYHNYHHEFQHDYRNGVKPWQWDPTKWLIWILSKLRLTSGLRRVPQETIYSAQTRLRDLRRKATS